MSRRLCQPRVAVRVRPARVARLLGIAVPHATIESLFGRLGLAFSRAGDDYLVTPPSYRFDLAIEEDFVEEIARLYGFDAIPAVVSAQPSAMLPNAEAERPAIDLKRGLVARGWQEVITFGFVSSAWETTLFPTRDANAAPILVLNPLASHLDVMRTTLAGGLIDVLRTNLSRKQERLRLFEAGAATGALPRVTTSPSAWAVSPTGRRCPSNGDPKPGPSTSSTSRATSLAWWGRER